MATTKKTAETMIDTINSIRNDPMTSAQYRSVVPMLTATNLPDFGATVLKYQLVTNEFISGIVNKIAFTLFERLNFVSPLNIFKETIAMTGDTIEDLHTNHVKAREFDDEGKLLFKISKPDTVSAYYTINRLDTYPITIQEVYLRRAFLSFENMANFIAYVVDGLYRGNEIDEYFILKGIIRQAVKDGRVCVKHVDPITDKASAERFVTQIKTYATKMRFPSANYNGYYLQDDPKPNARVDISRADALHLLVGAELDSYLQVGLLAPSFNLPPLEMDARKIVLDDFDTKNEWGEMDDTKIVATIFDRGFIKFFETMKVQTSVDNASGLFVNNFLHVEQVIGYSPFKNAMVFVADGEKPYVPPKYTPPVTPP